MLHPDFPVVSGNYQLTENWSVTLPQEVNRRIENQDLVLWRHGFTAWISLWNNDHEETVQQRIDWLQSDTNPNALDVTVQAATTPALYSYRLNENREEGVVYALHGYALNKDGHLQIAVYVDQEGDIEPAKSLIESIRQISRVQPS